MKRISCIIIVLLSFASCGDMFMREIEYNGATEPEMLALSADLAVGGMPQFKVGHSHFIGNGNADLSSMRSVMVDASMRVNGGPWLPMTHSDSLDAYVQEDILLQPHDTVEIRASNPDYPMAVAHQVMPGQLSARIVSYQVLPNYWVELTLEFDVYRGNPDDMIAVILTEGALYVQSSYGNAYAPLTNIYSTDPVFAEAQNPQVSGYYGAETNTYLFFPSSALQNKRQIRFIIDRQWNEDDRSHAINVQLDRLSIYAFATTYSIYRFDRSSLLAQHQFSIYAPSGMPESDKSIVDQVMDAIKESLGEQEPIHVYSNIEGGVGHIGGCSSTLLQVK
ncbi:MAG: hypothetical protein K6A36_03535 [Paludibacteraceae bacterium]|nr:hypothetical protein [Paludibacteraceae bacterium]